MIPKLFNVVFFEFLFTRIEVSFKLISVSYCEFPLWSCIFINLRMSRVSKVNFRLQHLSKNEFLVSKETVVLRSDEGLTLETSAF